MNANRLKEYFREKFREDGIYEIYCAWKGGSAHVFCAEVTEGKTRFFDPQTGKDDASNYIQSMKAGRVGVIRIDNKLVNPKSWDYSSPNKREESASPSSPSTRRQDWPSNRIKAGRPTGNSKPSPSTQPTE